MSLVWRYVVTAGLFVAAAMAWWFPEPVLIRGELIDWGHRYEQRHEPPTHLIGAMALGRAIVQSVSPPLPLTEFIAQSTAGRTVTVKDPAWKEILGEMTRRFESGNSTVRYFRPALPPCSDLDESARYVAYRDEKGLWYMEYRFIPAREFKTVNVPADQAFPLRPYWPVMLLICGTAAAFTLAQTRTADLVEASSAGRGMRWSGVFTVFFAGMVLWPMLYGTVGSGLSFASIMAGGLFGIGALAGLWLFGNQAGQLKDMVERQHYLAHFTYDPEEWKAFALWNYQEETMQRSIMWRLIFILSVLIGGGFAAVMRDEPSLWVFAGLMGFMALLWLLAVGLPKLHYRRDLRKPGEVYIGERCVYMNGSVHSWGILGSRLDSVHMEKNPLPHILLIYSYLMVAGRSLYVFRNYITVRIPVPKGQEAKGQKVIKHFFQKNTVH
jgi:hypothetical protein